MFLYIQYKDLLTAKIETIEDIEYCDNETEALIRILLDLFDNYTKLNTRIPEEMVAALNSITDPGRLADAVAAHLPLAKIQDRQSILEIQDTKLRMQLVIDLLAKEYEVLELEEKLKNRVKDGYTEISEDDASRAYPKKTRHLYWVHLTCKV
jgi:ATP-dependent Lon protease